MPEGKKIRMAISSDKAIVRCGLRTMIAAIKPAKLIGEAQTAEETIHLCQDQNPDLLLLNIHQETGEKAITLQSLLEDHPGLHILTFETVGDNKVHLEGLSGSRLFSLPITVSEEEFYATLDNLTRVILNHDNPLILKSMIQAVSILENEYEKSDSREMMRSGEVITRELVMAGKIQADILPEVAPSIKGWDIAARLIPARETSGDFYDFIPLNDRKMGIVIADVTDKGMGAALFMALSSTLLRTYAYRFPTLPGLTLKAVSDRILSDTRGSMFVTSIFGILEPHTGRFVYANAGHPPGFRITNQRGKKIIQSLKPTGMALGVSEQSQWRQKEVRLDPGDFLFLYTDGVVEAQNHFGDFFEEDRLMDAVLEAVLPLSAEHALDHLLDTVHAFVGKSPRQDDIAIVVIHRENEPITHFR